jgi:hypothetical protein
VQAALRRGRRQGLDRDWIGGGLLQKLKVASSQSNVILLTYSAEIPSSPRARPTRSPRRTWSTALDLRVAHQAGGVWFDDS